MERRIRVSFLRQPRRDEAAYPSWICGRGVTTDDAKSRRIRPSGLVKPLLVLHCGPFLALAARQNRFANRQFIMAVLESREVSLFAFSRYVPIHLQHEILQPIGIRLRMPARIMR